MGFLKHADSLYIGGEFVRAPNNEPVINPADESLIMMAPVGSTEMVSDAIGAARVAFDTGPWPRLPQAARIADRISRRNRPAKGGIYCANCRRGWLNANAR